MPRQKPTELQLIERTYKVFYNEDLIAYRYPFRFDSLVDYEPLVSEFRQAYFVYSKDSAYGYIFCFNTPSESGQRIHRDSAVSGFSPDKGNLDGLAGKNPDTSYKSKDGKTYVELFKESSDNGLPVPAVELTYTSGFERIAESISHKLDSARGRKLTSVVVSVPPMYAYAEKMPDSLKARWGFEKLQPSDTIGISEVFRWYRNRGWLDTKQ